MERKISPNQRIKNHWVIRDIMNKTFDLLGFTNIKEELKWYANTESAKQKIEELTLFLSERELRKNMRDTTQARNMLDLEGTPAIPTMDSLEKHIKQAVNGELLMPEELEQIGTFIRSVKRLKQYLERGKDKQIGIAFYADQLVVLDELQQEIEKSIRMEAVDDYASNTLRDVRKELLRLEEKMRNKAEQILKANKNFLAESFVVNRNGKICIPFKKEFRTKIQGTMVDKSATGNTLFIEPIQIAVLKEEFEQCKMEEENEVRRILYQFMNLVAAEEEAFLETIKTIVFLDFIFAKGRLSQELNAVEPFINTEQYLWLQGAKNPLIAKDICVPLDLEIGKGVNGIIITGPNTGGKTVAIKTAGLLSVMACTGLHIPCKNANISMFSQILCDIGDGQNIADNLSTFSAHIQNINKIVQHANEESLVILDELGSGTDPAEGMGIAIAILEQLRKSKCLFFVTTHYPEVKEFAARHTDVLNARMAFDRENLTPLYQLEIGKSGQSCALYIAKRLGIPNEMLRIAAKEAYGEKAEEVTKELGLEQDDAGILKIKTAKIQKAEVVKKDAVHGEGFTRGDSVEILPEGKIGIVVRTADEKGNVCVQVQKEKIMINHKRLKLKVAASQLYPEDYDFSIIFDTVENRKLRHQMGKHHNENAIIHLDI